MKLNILDPVAVAAFIAEHNLQPVTNPTYLEAINADALAARIVLPDSYDSIFERRAMRLAIVRKFQARTLQLEVQYGYNDRYFFSVCVGRTFEGVDYVRRAHFFGDEVSMVLVSHDDPSWLGAKRPAVEAAAVIGRRSTLNSWNSMRTRTMRSYKAGDRQRRIELGQLVGRVVREEDDMSGLPSAMSELLVDYSYTVPQPAQTVTRIYDALKEIDTLDHDYLPVLADCGHIEREYDLTPVRVNGLSWGGGQTFCSSCIDGREGVVDIDDEYYTTDSVYYWESDGEYHLDEEPEEDEDDDDDDDDSSGPDCLMDYSTDVMRYLSVDHSFKSTPYGDFHMGVEMETELRNHSVNGRVSSMRDLLGEDYLVAKRDGSLGGGGGAGIEWVTRPTSLAVHREKFVKLLVSDEGASVRQGLSAWNARCCGTHVHIDARAFTALSLGKLIQFFDDTKNAAFIRQIAGRHPNIDSQAEYYAGRSSSISGDISPAKVLKGKLPSRFVMVNTNNLSDFGRWRLGLTTNNYSDYGTVTCPHGTVEVRIFRASMRPERHLAQLEFTHALVLYCRAASMRQLNGEAFVAWLRFNGGAYPWLCKWYAITPKHGKVNNAPVVTETTSAEALDDATAGA